MLQFITGSDYQSRSRLLFAPIGGNFDVGVGGAVLHPADSPPTSTCTGCPSRSPLRMAISLSLSDVAMGFSKRFVPLAILPLPAAIVLKGIRLYLTLEGVDPGNSVPQVSRRVFTSTRCALCHVEDVQVRDSADRESSRRCDQGSGSHRRRGCWSIHRRRRRRDDRRRWGESRCGTRRCQKQRPEVRTATKMAGRRPTGGPRTTLEATNNLCPPIKTQPHGESWTSSVRRVASPTSISSRKATLASSSPSRSSACSLPASPASNHSPSRSSQGFRVRSRSSTSRPTTPQRGRGRKTSIATSSAPRSRSVPRGGQQ